ncbi:MAG: hypothetical protein AMXMBFR84_33630 [Candidatus Hydrogenedentota bacterium]
MLMRLTMGLWLVLASTAVSAQEPDQEATSEETVSTSETERGSQSDEAEPATTEVEQGKPSGDLVYLKNGQTISGLQVIRETSMSIVLDVMDKVVTIEIPRRQISKIEYDDIDPNNPAPKGDGTESNDEPVFVEAQRLSAEMQRRMALDISTPPIAYEAPTDLLTILSDINPRVGNAVLIDPSVESLDSESRMWTFKSEPGMTLSAFLKDALLKDFDNLELRYESDHVILKTKPRSETTTEPTPDTPVEGGATPVPGTDS